MRRRRTARFFALASALATGTWQLAAVPASADDGLPAALVAVLALPSVDAAPPARAASPPLWVPGRIGESAPRHDYYSRDDRARDALHRKRKGKWRVFKRHIPLPAEYEEDVDLYFRTPTKGGVKNRPLSAGFEVRF
jgi:hypothetical protein